MFIEITNNKNNSYAFFQSYGDYLKNNIKYDYCFIFEDVKGEHYKEQYNNKVISIINPKSFSATHLNNQLQKEKKFLENFRVKLSNENLKILNNMINNKIKDNEIYKFIKKNNILPAKEYGAYYYSQSIKNIIDDFGIHKITTYLDFGAGNGVKTASVSKVLNLDENNVFALDLESFWSSVNIPKNKINYIYYDGITIPKINKKIDLITMNHVLHHIKNLHSIMKQISNLCVKNTIIIVKEHDCIDESMRDKIDIEHCMYELVFGDGGKDDDNFMNSYYARYFSEEELLILFSMYGFINLELKQQQFKNYTNSKFYLFQKM